jgi:hypothetical protein
MAEADEEAARSVALAAVLESTAVSAYKLSEFGWKEGTYRQAAE